MLSDPISGGVKAVAGTLKNLVVDRIVEYLRFIKSYEDNMTELRNELKDLCAKKLDLDGKVIKGKENLEVMTRQTAIWLENVIHVIEGEEMKKLLKEEGVAEIVVKLMDRRALKNLWKEDRELFDTVINAVKNKCSRQEAGDGLVVDDDGQADADYNKVAKVASDVIKDIAEEFTKFIQSGDAAAVAVVKLLDDEHLKKLTQDRNEIAKILSKAEGVIRKKIEQHDDDDDDEKELLLPKNDNKDKSMVQENVGKWRKRMVGNLMIFLDDDNFKKSLPDVARVGLEVINALSNSSPGSEQQVEANDKSHRHCHCRLLHCQVYRHRHDMSQRAETMAKDIKSINDRCPSDSATRPRRDDELDIIPGVFAQGLESRELLVRKILTALKDDQVNIVGLHGMGGCGKTTIAKEIADKRTNNLFGKTVIIEVSEAPNIKGIQNQIAERIGLILDDMNSITQRARKLYNRLKTENILIVLDNIWKKLELDEVGIPLQSSNRDICCELLITTREERVCRLMEVQEANIHKVGLLNETEALSLFEKQTEKKVGRGELKDVADKLLKKCGGLPLAIATTASALKGKDLAMWCHFVDISEKPILSQVSSEYREIYSILETSYKLVDSEEKMTFLYLACLSPLDLAITVDDLMRYGTGLDLFQRVNGLSEAMDQADMWANELISSSLLLKTDTVGVVKIHDLVRASCISFIDKGKRHMTLIESIPRWMCMEMLKKLTAISLMSGHDFSRLGGVKAPLLEILLLKGDISLTNLASDFFKGMKNLKVLSVSNVNFNMGLPESMGDLKRLQTLHLHHCLLKDVKLIGKLEKLLVLSLRESTLEELAVEIGKLCNLRILDIGSCKGMKRIPANILSRLSNLEGLYMLNGFDGWASTNIQVNDGEGGGSDQARGSEVDTLSHLNVLEMEVSEAAQLLTVNNGELMEQLGKFNIRVRNFDGSREKLPPFRYVLELIDIDASPNNGLRALLKKAECLVLSDCKRLAKNVVPELEEDGFKDLKYFIVEKCEVQFVISSDEENESMAFPNLEDLGLINMDKIEKICDGKASVGMFSNLCRLAFIELPKLESGFPLTSALHNLSEVCIEDCESLKSIAYKDAKNETQVDDMFPCLKSLDLKGIKSLCSVVGQSDNGVLALFNTESKYPSLESLEMWRNDTIQTIWSPACYVPGFQNLKTLEIGWCGALQSFGSPSIFVALVQLEELKIRNCDSLQEVISNETEGDGVGDKAINFPKLKHLSLEDSRNIERFYRGSYNLKFPNLKSLHLSDIRDFTQFDDSENPTTLFSNKVEFPCLEELDVKGVSRQVLSLWNWGSSDVEGESENSFKPVPNLQVLRLGNISLNHGLSSIPQSVSHKLSHLQVSDFDNIEYIFSVSAVNGKAFCTYSQLPYLKNLTVCDCQSLEQLFDSQDDDVAISLCGRLIEITLDTLPKLRILPLHLLKNICTLKLRNLSWKYVLPADIFIKGNEQLQLLESLKIFNCENMEVIIGDELFGDAEEIVYYFPRLKILTLEVLNITKFASKPNTEIQFPSLERIKLSGCGKIQSFWSGSFRAPKLKTVMLQWSDNIECFLSGKRSEVQELPFLETVDIFSCRRLLSFSSGPLDVPKLHDVSLEKCPEMKWLIGGDPNSNDIVELPSLESVFIRDSHDMKSLSLGGTEAPKLCELVVDDKDYSKCSNKELQEMLANLKILHIRKEEEEEGKDEGDQSAGQMEELRNDGSQDEQNTNGDKELEEIRTEEQCNDKSQQEQSKE